MNICDDDGKVRTLVMPAEYLAKSTGPTEIRLPADMLVIVLELARSWGLTPADALRRALTQAADDRRAA